MQKLKKEKEMELAAREEKIKNNNLELNSVKSNDAYKALLTEIDNAKIEKTAFEDEILGSDGQDRQGSAQETRR